MATQGVLARGHHYKNRVEELNDTASTRFDWSKRVIALPTSAPKKVKPCSGLITKTCKAVLEPDTPLSCLRASSKRLTPLQVPTAR